jgi:hypothetical protein
MATALAGVGAAVTLAALAGDPWLRVFVQVMAGSAIVLTGCGWARVLTID